MDFSYLHQHTSNFYNNVKGWFSSPPHAESPWFKRTIARIVLISFTFGQLAPMVPAHASSQEDELKIQSRRLARPLALNQQNPATQPSQSHSTQPSVTPVAQGTAPQVPKQPQNQEQDQRQAAHSAPQPNQTSLQAPQADSAQPLDQVRECNTVKYPAQHTQSFGPLSQQNLQMIRERNTARFSQSYVPTPLSQQDFQKLRERNIVRFAAQHSQPAVQTPQVSLLQQQIQERIQFNADRQKAAKHSTHQPNQNPAPAPLNNTLPSVQTSATAVPQTDLSREAPPRSQSTTRQKARLPTISWADSKTTTHDPD